jgi:two-component system chemotaxis response regulator CheB
MAKQNIVVIGASAGGLEVLKTLVKGLPKNFQASIFITWHISPNGKSILPDILDRAGPLKAAHAVNGEKIAAGRIYVAPSNHHMLIENDHIRLTKGPKENRFRPAIDPLFRSAAYTYESRVIGVILTGMLDDGTAGLWLVKDRGGIAVVQDPQDAQFSPMPESALRAVEVDYCVPSAKLPDLLVRLTKEEAQEIPAISMKKDKRTEIEIRIAAEDNAFESGVMELGPLTPFTCPECQGVLLKLRDGKIVRYRCHTGHAFSANTLLSAITESTEDILWSTIRSIEEGVMLLNEMGRDLAEVQPRLAELYFKKADEAEQRAKSIRQTIMKHEQLSKEHLQQQVRT